jgi:hypothetical protein
MSAVRPWMKWNRIVVVFHFRASRSSSQKLQLVSPPTLRNQCLLCQVKRRLDLYLATGGGNAIGIRPSFTGLPHEAMLLVETPTTSMLQHVSLLGNSTEPR